MTGICLGKLHTLVHISLFWRVIYYNFSFNPLQFGAILKPEDIVLSAFVNVLSLYCKSSDLYKWLMLTLKKLNSY